MWGHAGARRAQSRRNVAIRLPSPLTCAPPPPPLFTDVSSGPELCQRGGEQALPRSPDGAAGEETEEKRYLLACCRLTGRGGGEVTRFLPIWRRKRAAEPPSWSFCLLDQTSLERVTFPSVRSRRTTQEKAHSSHPVAPPITQPGAGLIRLFFAWFCSLRSLLASACGDASTLSVFIKKNALLAHVRWPA